MRVTEYYLVFIFVFSLVACSKTNTTQQPYIGNKYRTDSVFSVETPIMYTYGGILTDRQLIKNFILRRNAFPYFTDSPEERVDFLTTFQFIDHNNVIAETSSASFPTRHDSSSLFAVTDTLIILRGHQLRTYDHGSPGRCDTLMLNAVFANPTMNCYAPGGTIVCNFYDQTCFRVSNSQLTWPFIATMAGYNGLTDSLSCTFSRIAVPDMLNISLQNYMRPTDTVIVQKKSLRLIQY